MNGEPQPALAFEFGIVGDELELSDDESLLSQVSAQASKLEIQVLHQAASSSSWKRYKDGQFQDFLKELLRELQPGNADHLARLNVVDRLSSALEHMTSFRGATLSTFGSFESNLYTRWADLDLSLELPDRSTLLQPISKKVKVKILKALLRTLTRKGEARKVQFIPYARVPLITFEDSRYSISCDVSVDNDTAIVKSRMLRWLCDVDSRCRDLIYLVKFWAKAHDINDPKLGTLNSFALCLLVIFHLQTRSPPVLPPLSSMLDEDIGKHLKGCENLTEEVSKSCWEKLQPFIGNKFGAQNRSTVLELFATFINQFSAVKELWSQGLAVCTFRGAWGDRSSTCGKWRSKGYVMAIEDPFDFSENCARSVHYKTFNSIVKAFTSTAEAISHPPVDIGMSSLVESLFLWPANEQALGLRAWLSKVLSKDEKYRREQLNVGTKQQFQYQHLNYNSKEVSFDLLVKNTFESQFSNQLQLHNSGPSVPKKKKRKKKVSHGGPTTTVGAGLGNSPDSELRGQNSRHHENVVRVTRKPTVIREGISPAVVDRRAGIENSSLSETYAKIDVLSATKYTRQTAYPAIERPCDDHVAMGSTESSSLTIPPAHSRFMERDSYASTMKNADRQGSMLRKESPALVHGARAPKMGHGMAPKMGRGIPARNEGGMEPPAIIGANHRAMQGEKSFGSRRVYSQAPQVWMPRQMSDKYAMFSSPSEGQRQTGMKYEDHEPLPKFEKAGV